MLHNPGVKPEVDGTTQGVAIATSAALTVEELASVFEQLPSDVVVADCTERRAGSIELHSTPNRGTTFRLVFPRAASPTNGGSKLDEKDASDPQRCVRILVVEDEEQLARMAKLVLTQRGNEVVLASSGDAAVDPARAHSPDTRFVLVTGWGAAIDPEQARTRGVDEVLAKPYRIADLRRVADRVAGGLNNV